MIAETNESCAARTESAGFKSTHWTVVLEAARQDSVSGQAALGSLYETYWAPIYAFVRRSGQLPHEADNVTPETLFERRWALGILEGALERLRQEYERMEKGDLFGELNGFLSGGTRPMAHAEIAARHDISVNAVGVAIHRMRRRFGELVRSQVAR